MTISATIIGRLGAPPETRQVGQHTVTEFRVATDHGFGDRRTTTWVSVSIWGKRGQTAADHFSKGDGIIFTQVVKNFLRIRTDGKQGGAPE